MARVLVTGSSDGLGLLAAQLLIRDGHEVVLHARNDARAADALGSAPGAAGVIVGDLESVSGMREVAEAANATGRFDAVIHNAAIGSNEPRRFQTPEDLSQVFAVNVLAPYLLTALIETPDRLVYMSSGMHHSGDPSLVDLQWERRRWNGAQAYADSKLFVAALCFAVARHLPGVRSNAVDPGWVPTKMGGPEATDDLSFGFVTQAWLAVSQDKAAQASGGFFFHKAPVVAHPAADDHKLQEGLLAACAEICGVQMFGTPQGA
jgi:NAD(P)-dependent dehydrogenase (short-subunit alcohol dehydrogenase family)